MMRKALDGIVFSRFSTTLILFKQYKEHITCVSFLNYLKD